MRFTISQFQCPQFPLTSNPPSSSRGVRNGCPTALHRYRRVHEVFLLPLRHNPLIEAAVKASTTIVRCLASQLCVGINLFIQHSLVDFTQYSSIRCVRSLLGNFRSRCASLNHLRSAETERPILLYVLFAHKVLGDQVSRKFSAVTWCHNQASVAKKCVFAVNCDRASHMPPRVVPNPDDIVLTRGRTDVWYELCDVGAILDWNFQVECLKSLMLLAWCYLHLKKRFLQGCPAAAAASTSTSSVLRAVPAPSGVFVPTCASSPRHGLMTLRAPGSKNFAWLQVPALGSERGIQMAMARRHRRVAVKFG
mmetsp:Transcript_5992/g.13906  ORF Transcript_5992/g.13906 Transcript_5992/m.13906 type:complete len:308 (-) Transcript_5992:50-973(-)